MRPCALLAWDLHEAALAAEYGNAHTAGTGVHGRRTGRGILSCSGTVLHVLESDGPAEYSERCCC